MRPGNIGWDDLPLAVKRELGMSPPKRTSSKVTAWKDVPSSWGVCRPHGMAWWPKDAGCVHCEYGDEGIDHVEAPRPTNLNQ